MTEIWRMGAAELATRIRAREVSSREVVQAHLDRIQAVNPRLNAVTAVLADPALAAADAADAAVRSGAAPGPLCGVPMTVKENMDVAGSATTFGLAVLRNAIAKEDGPLVASAARRRRDPDRTHQHARVRRALAHRERALGRHAQPVVGRAHAGSVERRRGGGARGRPLAARPRQRRRRVAALAGAVLRRRRAQALVRARAAGLAGARAGAADPVRVPAPGGQRTDGAPRARPAAGVRADVRAIGRRPLARRGAGRRSAAARARSASRWRRTRAGSASIPTSPPRCAAPRRRSRTPATSSRQRDPPALARANEIYTQIMTRFGRTTEELPSTAGLVGDEFQRFWDAWNPVWAAACGKPVYDPMSERAVARVRLGHVPRGDAAPARADRDACPRSASTPSSTPSASPAGRRRCA